MIIFTKYSNERRPELRIRTDIIKKEDGTKCIRKRAASGQAWEHVQKIYERYLWLERDLRGTSLKVNQCSTCKDGVQFPFLEGRTLEEKLDELLYKKKTDELVQEIARYLEMFAGDCVKKASLEKRDSEDDVDEKEIMSKDSGADKTEFAEFRMTPEFKAVFGETSFSQVQYCRKVSDIDMIFSNAIESGDGYELIDYEWTFHFPVPVKFIVYRCLYYYVLGNTKRDELIGENLYERFGISEEEKEQFAKMEQNFQAYILGDYTPVWKQYDDISEGVIELSSMLEQAGEQKKLRTAEVYFDDGRGFGTWNWKKYGVQENGTTRLEIKLPAGTKQVRLDPCSCRSVVRIEKLTQGGKKLTYTSNGAAAPNGDLIFDTEDPQIIFAVEGTSSVKVAFRSEVIGGLGREVLLNQQGHISWMEQTKAWKLYQKLKGTRRK